LKKKLVLNSLSGASLYFINIVAAFIMSPVIIRALGNRDYGLWELVMSVIGYMGLLDLGIGPALVRFVSVASGKQDRDDMQQTISTAFAFFLVIGTVSVLFFALLGYSPRMIAGNETKDIANIGTVFLLFGLNAGIMLPLQVFIATLMGVQRHYFINFSRGVLLIVRSILAYYLLQRFSGKGLIVMALLEPVFSFIQFILFVGAVQLDKQIPGLSMAAVTWRKLKELFTFGVKNATMMIASRLQNQSVPFIIGHVIGLGSIVYFVMPNRMIDYAKGLSMAIGFPLTPYFGATFGKGDHDELVKSWLTTTLVLQMVTMVMPIVIFFYGETFLSLWIGKAYADAGRGVIYFLLVGLAADALATNAFRMLTAQGQHGKSALIWLCLSVASIPLGVIGASLWGVPGVAMGTTTTMVVGNLVTIRMTCTAMRVPMQSYFHETLQQLLIPLTLLAVTLFLCTRVLPVEGYGNIVLQLLIGICVYLASVWVVTLNAAAKAQIIERVKARISRPSEN